MTIFGWLIDCTWLPKSERYVGPRKNFYDGPIYSVGCWFFNVYWFRP